METVSKKQFKYRNNIVAVKVERDPDDGLNLHLVTVVCAWRRKRVKGKLTCKKSNVDYAIKRLIRYQLLNQPLGSKY